MFIAKTTTVAALKEALDDGNEYKAIVDIFDIIEEIIKQPHNIITELKQLKKDKLASIIEDGKICPECGAELKWEANGNDEHFSLDGMTMLIAEGGENVCPECGWSK